MLRAENISKSFKDKKVLESVSLQLNAGEVVMLLGPNGCGKSTLLSILALTLKPDSGNVIVDDSNINANNNSDNANSHIANSHIANSHNANSRIANSHIANSGIAFTPQRITLFEELTLMENLMAWSSLNKKEAKPRAQALIDKLDMKEFSRKRVDKLSGGQRRRVNLAVTLMSDFDYLLLDEPFAGIDSQGEELIKNLIREEKAKGRGILIAEHNREIINELADRIINLDNLNQTQD